MCISIKLSDLENTTFFFSFIFQSYFLYFYKYLTGLTFLLHIFILFELFKGFA